MMPSSVGWDTAVCHPQQARTPGSAILLVIMAAIRLVNLDWQCLDVDFDFPFSLIKRLCTGYLVRSQIPDSNCIAGAGVLCQSRFANFNWPTLLSSSL